MIKVLSKVNSSVLKLGALFTNLIGNYSPQKLKLILIFEVRIYLA